MELDPDFREFVRLFIDNEVRFLIIGGYALAAHGAPRYTGDLDAWIWLDRTNAERVVEALRQFGFGSLGLSVADFTTNDTVIQLGRPPHRIDLLTTIDGVSFDDAWTRRIECTAGDLSFPCISKEDLIANKRAVGRPQDLVDVERLKNLPGG